MTSQYPYAIVSRVTLPKSWHLRGGRGYSIVKDYRTNERIRVREVLLIGESGESLGVVPLGQALQLARERELDVVEVAPTADPPVCRLMDYGKFRYDQAKKEREARKTQTVSDIRELRFRPGISERDLSIKVRSAERFLSEGDKVKITVMFRGREMSHQDLGLGVLRKVAETLKSHGKLEKAPSLEGRHLSIVLAPLPHKPAKLEKQPATTESHLVEAQKV